MGKVRHRKRINKRKCQVCKEYYFPDFRNVRHQKTCSKRECRKARRAASQHKWSRKPENRDYWKGPHHVKRVQNWRKQNPGYGAKTKPRKPPSSLQDDCFPELAHNKEDTSLIMNPPLQDLLIEQHALIVGLISLISGSTLQDDIGQQTREILQRGQDVLGTVNRVPGALTKHREDSNEDKQTSPVSGTAPPGSRTFQLAGPSPGPG